MERIRKKKASKGKDAFILYFFSGTEKKKENLTKTVKQLFWTSLAVNGLFRWQHKGADILTMFYGGEVGYGYGGNVTVEGLDHALVYNFTLDNSYVSLKDKLGKKKKRNWNFFCFGFKKWK